MRSLPLPAIALLLLTATSAAAPGMSAAVLQRARVVVQTVPRPVLRPDQILVRLTDAGVNPIDWQRANERFKSGAPPSIQGVDGAGFVESVGTATRGIFKTGDAVVVWSPDGGTYAQYIAAANDNIALKPGSLSMAQAAGLPQAGIAAWRALIDVGKLQSGQQVLIIGGSGGVGSAAIQIAKMRGARVIATTSAANAQYVKSLGADQVINYVTEHFEDRLRDVDLAINTVDIDNAYRALPVIKRGGRLVSTAGVPAAAQCNARAIECSGLGAAGTPAAVILKQLTAWADAGRYQINIDRTYSLGEVVRAWEYSESGHTRGKSVIHIGD